MVSRGVCHQVSMEVSKTLPEGECGIAPAVHFIPVSAASTKDEPFGKTPSLRLELKAPQAVLTVIVHDRGHNMPMRSRSLVEKRETDRLICTVVTIKQA